MFLNVKVKMKIKLQQENSLAGKIKTASSKPNGRKGGKDLEQKQTTRIEVSI